MTEKFGFPRVRFFSLNFLKNEEAEPGATANEHACHGLCSEQHTPRQARSSLSLNVRQENEKDIPGFHVVGFVV